jgi:hypothetical protein
MVNLRLSIVKIRFCYRVGLLSPGLGAVSKNAVVWGDRGFESISLQQRVECEPDILALEKCGNPLFGNTRVRIHLPPARGLLGTCRAAPSRQRELELVGSLSPDGIARELAKVNARPMQVGNRRFRISRCPLITMFAPATLSRNGCTEIWWLRPIAGQPTFRNCF